MSSQNEQSEFHPPFSNDSDSSTANDTPQTLDESQTMKLLEDAEELKQEGNAHFRSGRWNEAIVAYKSALGRLPKRPQKKRTPKDSIAEADEGDRMDFRSQKTREDDERSKQELDPEETTLLPAECAKARSVLSANIAAVHFKLDEHSEVVAACTEALQDDPGYIKALQRRAASNEVLDTWASLTSAQEDYTKLLTLLTSESVQYIDARRKLAAIKPRAEAAQKKETSEMFDKLKGIGNSILGNFGLSTNNFQFTPNGQGGYSMQFVQ
ncbi:hypothetical protein BDY19DRAFT_988455 [Irpex rosettiformis]|uniref:Uncharacterized protein n=1 Tax=Irpex rosettiformis TaxID=378272 RepID=A0ACB8UJX9_9APHY|nr:hypothetical protein BDY19DRAFT_988455 [Irpex rosettiformis]